MSNLFGMRIYLRILSGLYLLGAILHLLDVLGRRLHFMELPQIWQAWIVYLLIFDLLAAIGLWRLKRWGIFLFLFIASSQLIAYLGFREIFGDQRFLIVFHIITISIFIGLRLKKGPLQSGKKSL